MLQLTAKEVMVSPVETISATESMRSVATQLTSQGIGSLVVCENNTPVGIITEGDVVKLVSEGKDPNSTSVESVMSGTLETIGQDDPISNAAKLMRKHDVKRLPVTDESDEIVGIVTTTDLSNYLPHIVRAGRTQEANESRKRESVRADTAYEKDEWSYEYLGDESSVEVGDTSQFTKTLSEDDVEQFAEISGDTNRLHLDEEYASETRFGERIAHGTLVSGVISAALARLPGLVIYLSQDLTFLGPVPLDTAVTANCEVVEQVAENQYRLATVVERADGEQVIDGEALVLADEIPVE
jgi:CBS domain-containing protein/acyl dehydratase